MLHKPIRNIGTTVTCYEEWISTETYFLEDNMNLLGRQQTPDICREQEHVMRQQRDTRGACYEGQTGEHVMIKQEHVTKTSGTCLTDKKNMLRKISEWKGIQRKKLYWGRWRVQDAARGGNFTCDQFTWEKTPPTLPPPTGHYDLSNNLLYK